MHSFAWEPECGWTLTWSAPKSAPARVALGVLVGSHRADRLEHGLGDEVLGGDELDPVGLTERFPTQHVGDGRVRRSERAPAVPRQVVDLGHAHGVAAAFEGCGQPRLDDLPRRLGVGAIAG
jgi:hypothetical protein